MEQRDFRNVNLLKGAIASRIAELIKKFGFDGSYSLCSTEAVILLNTNKDWEICVNRDVYELLANRKRVPVLWQE